MLQVMLVTIANDMPKQVRKIIIKFHQKFEVLDKAKSALM